MTPDLSAVESHRDFRRLPVALLAPSKHNEERSKRYDKATLQELADSIKSNGLAQPILVTPLPGGPGKDYDHIIVAGERRWRAHQLAGLQEIDCVVRDLSEKQVLELQIIENMQREGVHPLQEADGYGELLKHHGLTVEQLAARVGKSRSYIFARLKLRDLCPDVRTAFYEGKIGGEVAGLLARIGNLDLQKKALKEVATGRGMMGEPMSFRDARAHIHETYMLRLDAAPFDPKDATLPGGACVACPKRAGNQPELFADVKHGDTCTDPACFGQKRNAHGDRLVAAAAEKGQKVIEGKAAKKLFPYGPRHVDDRSGFVELDAESHAFGYKSARKVLGKDLPQPTLVRNPHNGAIVEVVKTADVLEVMKEKGLISKHGRSESVADARWREQQRQREAKARLRTEVNKAIYEAVRVKIRAKPTAADLQMVASAFFNDVWHESRKRILQLWGIDEKGAINKIEPHVAKMSADDLVVFVCDCAMAKEIHVGQYEEKQVGPVLAAAAKRHGVDADKIKREVEAAAREKAKASKAKKAAKK